MALVDGAAVGHVDADPAPRVHIQADIDPGVAGQVRFIGGIKIAADISRRNAQAAADRHHHMRLVLAHAGAGFKGLQGRGRHCGAIFLIADHARHALAKGQKHTEIGTSANGRRHKAPAKLGQPLVGCRQVGGAQEKSRVRHAGRIAEFGDAEGLDVTGRIDQAPAHVVRDLADKGVGADLVAEGVRLLEQFLGRAQAPEMHGLRRPGQRRQPHGLQRIPQGLGIAVVGDVTDV
jgi:hypothetical protein